MLINVLHLFYIKYILYTYMRKKRKVEVEINIYTQYTYMYILRIENVRLNVGSTVRAIRELLITYDSGRLAFINRVH